MTVSRISIEPGYIALYHSGELERRAKALEARLAACDICPRECRVNRIKNDTGVCHSGYLPIVSSVCAHSGEEPALSGTRGSGTIFFGNCTMSCVYCQNYQISQDWREQQSKAVDCHTLAEKMLFLQDELCCHNINLVSPSHFVPQIINALMEAVPEGLHIPLVYNTSGYDSLETLKELDGIISIYLPDLRYASEVNAKKLSSAGDYVAHARKAIVEMHRQVGNLVEDEAGIAQRGVIVRLLILPNGLAGCEESLTWLAQDVSPSVTVSIMSQYYPTHNALQIPLLSRKITMEEYQAVVRKLNELGMDNGWMQEVSAPEYYLPDFKREGHPFQRGNSA